MTNTEQLTEFLEWYAFRRHRREGLSTSPKTLQTLASRVRRLLLVANCRELSLLATITASRDGVEKLLDRTAVKASSGGQRGLVYALRAVSEYGVAQGWIEECRVEKSDAPKYVRTKPVRTYPDEDVALLLRVAHAQDLRWWALLTFLADSGRRIGEALSLEWTWLRIDTEVPHFHLPHTKNGQQQYVPLSERLVAQVFTPENVAVLKLTEETRGQPLHRDPQEFVFPWGYGPANLRLHRFCKNLGVECHGFHAFRHTRATNQLASGVPIQAVSAILGHSSVQTTDRAYNHTSALSYANYIK